HAPLPAVASAQAGRSTLHALVAASPRWVHPWLELPPSPRLCEGLRLHGAGPRLSCQSDLVY
ncbi:MAG TPA: hypothetical protein VN829_14625, partial [Dongiaceae bacterium]|nr:hypothetical protein [Dongiaceae bacterium]